MGSTVKRNHVGLNIDAAFMVNGPRHTGHLESDRWKMTAIYIYMWCDSNFCLLPG